MPTEAFTCPNCSAPLHVEPNQTLALCIYCNSTVRLNYPAGSAGNAAAAPARAVVEHTLSPETTGQIRQLILSGHQPEAIQLYQKEAQATPAEAKLAIDCLALQITWERLKIEYNQPLGPRGWFFFLLGVALVILSVVAGVKGAIPLWLAIVGLAGGTFLILPLWGFLRVTIKYIPGKTATARVLKLAAMDTTHEYYTYRAWLEVQPREGQTFRTQKNLAVLQKDRSRLHENTVLQVKYLPGNPDSVIFHKLLKY